MKVIGNMKDDVEKLRGALFSDSERGRKSFDTLIRLYRGISLSSAALPDECFEIIIDILSSDKLFSKNGIDSFVMELSTDMGRLTEQQKFALMEGMRGNTRGIII
ncbi:hypothetical protein [Methylovirgula sp. 4M-Z18]|uniref:hypothetical protein n=1 Tax=Methylovirgula sp. 4M-Z18 TaxID=2293567 RepID=UPI000E3853FE|nr:hypothetical protein [Methylovirgula sp. 4M-Z18]RFB80932.1 hypothetical protein DYH55_05530 [Methylovirgula sp. 4M-Z18]